VITGGQRWGKVRSETAEERSMHGPIDRPGTAGSAAELLRYASGFWTGRAARPAMLLAGAILLLLLANLVVNIGINRWQRWFFDMLERREVGFLPLALAMLMTLIASGAAFAVAMVKCRMTLQLKWREWLTENLIRAWFAGARPGLPIVVNENRGSPAFRVAEDVRLALEPIVDLTVGLVHAAISAVTFVGILILVGGALEVSVAGFHVAVPAYMAFAALIYASLVSSTMWFAGQPLIRRVEQKNESEAQFLFALTRAVEGEALNEPGAGPSDALHDVSTAFRRALGRWRRVIQEHCRLTWITNSSSFFAPMLPLLLAAPKYINGEISLGAMMQIASAFTIVLGALNWLTDNYIRIAEWSASARRVDQLRQELAAQAGA
jgi:vitamin B12/bleomycin/antimicrobial peptide transport system ATP-binding/permease protein